MKLVAGSRQAPGPRIALASALAIALAGCSGATQGTPAGATISVRLNPSQVAIAVAQDEGLFENLNVQYSQVAYGEDSSLFLAGNDPIGNLSPWEVAQYRSQGENLVFFGTSAALNFWNGVIIRQSDVGKYKSITDLVGKKLGQPGFGSGTWQAFEILVKSLYGIDARTSFNLVEADPGALLGLLSTGQIDAALNFAAQAATGMSSEDFETIFSFTKEWQKAEKQPLTINGLVAKGNWIKDNVDIAKRYIAGSEKGLQWIKDNPDAVRPGGKYAKWVEGEGWFSSPETTDFIIQRLEAGEWYFTQDMYTQTWIDSVYKFVSQGQGVFADVIPPKEEIFFPPDQLKGG